MAVDVKAVGGHGIKHLLRHIGRRHVATGHSFGGAGFPHLLAAGFDGVGILQAGRPVAAALVDAGGDKKRAQHAGADLLRDQ